MFNDTSRFLHDILTLDNPDFEKHISDIYRTKQKFLYWGLLIIAILIEQEWEGWALTTETNCISWMTVGAQIGSHKLITNIIYTQSKRLAGYTKIGKIIVFFWTACYWPE